MSYVPPHLRGKPASSAPSTSSSSFSDRGGGGGGGYSSNRNDSPRSGGYSGGSDSRSGGYSGGGGGGGYGSSRRSEAKRDPNDQFFDRTDVQPRDLRMEEKLFGTEKATPSGGINFDNYDNIPVDVSGQDCPDAIGSFADSDIDPLLKDTITRAGYTHPTPVQKNSVPIVCTGRDLMACGMNIGF